MAAGYRTYDQRTTGRRGNERSQFYVYISKSKNGQQYLDSMGGAAVTSHKEQYTGAVFLVEQAAMRTAAPQKEDELYE